LDLTRKLNKKDILVMCSFSTKGRASLLLFFKRETGRVRGRGGGSWDRGRRWQVSAMYNNSTTSLTKGKKIYVPPEKDIYIIPRLYLS